MLLIVDYQLALTVLAVLGLFYGLIYRSISKLLKRVGTKRYESNMTGLKLAESLFAIKVKIESLEDFAEQFNKPAKEFANIVIAGYNYTIAPLCP